MCYVTHTFHHPKTGELLIGRVDLCFTTKQKPKSITYRNFMLAKKAALQKMSATPNHPKQLSNPTHAKQTITPSPKKHFRRQSMTTGELNIITEEKEPLAPDDHSSASGITLEETPKLTSKGKTKPPVVVTFSSDESPTNTDSTVPLHERNRNRYCTSKLCCHEVIIAALTLAAVFLVVCFFYLPITSENNSVADAISFWAKESFLTPAPMKFQKNDDAPSAAIIAGRWITDQKEPDTVRPTALTSTSKVSSSSRVITMKTKTNTKTMPKIAPTFDTPPELTNYHYGNLQVVSPNQPYVFSPLVNGYLISEIGRHAQISDEALKPYFGSNYRNTIRETREVYHHVFPLHGYTETKILIDRKNNETESCHPSGISSGVSICYGSGEDFSRNLKADFNVDDNDKDLPVASSDPFAYAFSTAQFRMPFASGRGALYGETELKSNELQSKFVDQLIFKTDMIIKRYGKADNIVSVPLRDPAYKFITAYNENPDDFVALGREELRARLSVEGERIHGHFVIPKIEQKSLVTIKDFGSKKIMLDNNNSVFQNIMVGTNFSLTAEGVNMHETKKRLLQNRKDSIPLVHIQPPFEYGVMYSKDETNVWVAYGTLF